MGINKFIMLLALITCISCEQSGYWFNEGKLPDTPVNLSDFNTQYDDYNSTAPTLGRLIPFCFSTNRNSSGKNFDIIYQPMNVSFSKLSGTLTVKNEYLNWGIYQPAFDRLNDGLSMINTVGNEFGPYLLVEDNNVSIASFDFTLLYATDINGNFDINYTFNTYNTNFSNTKTVKFLNSASNDLYPSLNGDKSSIYFCSDRENEKYDIFFATINPLTLKIKDVLGDTSIHEVVKDTTLSSNYDDKCPYIFGITLVFTSNRPGGYGGFDLYYSTFINGKWNKPTNFGPEINSTFDEYRPIVFDPQVDSTRDMMVFSSNRPGGKGGFDLYFVGVKKTI